MKVPLNVPLMVPLTALFMTMFDPDKVWERNRTL